MYLRGDQETGVLLRLIWSCARLVEKGKISADNAFLIIAEEAKNHSDYPEETKTETEKPEAVA